MTAAPGAVPAPRSPLALFDQDFPLIDGVTAAVYDIPTDRPEADGTLAWAKTTLVIASVTAGGAKGLGYGTDLPYFARMVDAGAVDCLQVDVTARNLGEK